MSHTISNKELGLYYHFNQGADGSCGFHKIIDIDRPATVEEIHEWHSEFLK